MNLSNHPAFVAYAITCVALCCNLIFLWAYSGAARSKAKSTPNSEDASRFNSILADVDPPEIARVLRAHANAQATIVSAASRHESRGAHTVNDYNDSPEHPNGRNDVDWHKHTLWYRDGNRLSYKPVQMKPLTVDSVPLKVRTF